MNRSRWKAVLVLAAVFVAGGVAGGVVSRVLVQRAVVRLLDQPPDEVRARAILFRLDAELELTPDQREALRAVLARHRTELKEIRRSISPQLQAARRAQWAEMREALSERQRPAFDRLTADMEARASRAMAGP